MKKYGNKEKLVLLVTVIMLVVWALFTNSNGGYSKAPLFPSIFVHISVWILAGALINIFPEDKALSMQNSIVAIIMGLLFLLLAWYLPARFPALKSNDHGLVLDLQKSPLVLWASVAFLLGYYRRMVLKIPLVVWNQIRKKFGIKEDDDQKGFAKYRTGVLFTGIGQILGFDNSSGKK